MPETPFVFRKDSFLTFSRYRRETALHRVLCHSRNRSAVNTSFSAPQIRYGFLRSRPPRRRPRFLPVGALVSSRRFAGAICSFAVAIQLSMRFIISRRAKARWFLERGSPALCSRAESGPCVCDAQSACLRGMRHTSICKSVRFRLAYNSSWLSLRESCRRRRLRGSAACYPLRPRCARPPLPKGNVINLRRFNIS